MDSPEDFARQLIRDRTYMKQEDQMEKIEVQVQNKLDELQYPQKSLQPYTGEPLGAIKRAMTGGDPKLASRCLQALRDVEAKLIPRYEVIKEYQHAPIKSKARVRYVKETRPAESVWKGRVSIAVANLSKDRIEGISMADTLTPVNRHRMARLRSLRRAAGVKQGVIGGWLGLSNNDIAALEMREPYKAFGQPSAECQRRVEAYEEIMEFFLYAVADSQNGKHLFPPDEHLAKSVPPDAATVEPASLKDGIKIHINADPSELNEVIEKLNSKIESRFAEVEGIPEHVLVEYVAENPRLFLDIARKMNACGVVNPALMPSTADEVNLKRTELMIQLQEIMAGMEKRSEAFGEVMAEVSGLFNDLIGAPPSSHSLRHANDAEKIDRLVSSPFKMSTV